MQPHPTESSAGSSSSTASPSPSTAESTALLHELEELMEPLAEKAPSDAQVKIAQLREISCLRPEHEAPQTETSWLAVLAGHVPSEAEVYQREVVAQLEQAGFEVRNTVEADPSGENGALSTTYTRRGDLSAVVTHGLQGGKDHVELQVKSPCTEHPEDHQMLRSTLDPEYGRSSALYADNN